MDVLGLIGIIVAVALFIFLVYKGWRNLYVSLICAAIVVLTNKMDFIQQLTDGWIAGVMQMFSTCFSVIFLGTIFGRVYSATGASISLANWLDKTFVEKRKNANGKVWAAVICYFAISSLVIIGGIDCFAAFFSLFPIAVIFAEKANIPRRFLPGILYLNCAFFACPGVPIIYNVITKAAFAGEGYDYSVWAAPVPGIIATAIIGVGSVITLSKMIIKAQAKGEVFEFGEVEHYEIPQNRKLPHPLLAVVPLVLVFVLYSIVGLDIFYALSIGIVVDVILMGRYMVMSEEGQPKKPFIPSLKKALNQGVGDFPNAILDVSCPNGLATIITGTAAFGGLVAALGGIKMHPLWMTIIIVCILVAILSSPPVALLVGIPVVVSVVVAQGGTVDPNAIGRVAAIASGTFETLPFNGAIITTMALAKVTHKEGYLPEFLESVVYMLIGTVVCALLLTIFPGLS